MQMRRGTKSVLKRVCDTLNWFAQCNLSSCMVMYAFQPLNIGFQPMFIIEHRRIMHILNVLQPPIL